MGFETATLFSSKRQRIQQPVDQRSGVNSCRVTISPSRAEEATAPQAGEGTVTTPPPNWGRLGGGGLPTGMLSRLTADRRLDLE